MALTDKLVAIADAIREKTGGTEKLTLDQMPAEIEGIASGDTSFEDGLVTGTLTDYSNTRVTTVRMYGFYGFSSVKTVTLPNVTDIGTDSFRGSGAETVSLASYDGTRGGVGCFFGSALITIYAPLLKEIPQGFFRSCSKLAGDVDFDNIETVGRDSLRECALMHGTVSFKNLQALGQTALYGNAELESVVFGENSFTINSGAFQNCTALAILALPHDGVIALGNTSAFSGTPFASGGTGGTVYVPAALIETYQTATNWSTLYAAGTCNFVAIEGSEYE